MEQQKAIFQQLLAVLPDAIDQVSGGGEYHYSCQQLFYAVRNRMVSGVEAAVQYEIFVDLIARHEEDRGYGLPGLVRDVRGVYYAPGTDGEVPFRSLLAAKGREIEVCKAERILVLGKKSLFDVLHEAGWPERHGCSLICALGCPARLVGDVIGHVASPRVTVFVIHDADAGGTVAVRMLREVMAAVTDTEVMIADLGLYAEEALQMGLPVQKLARRQPPVEDLGVPDEWRDWYSGNRIELDELSVPQLIEWLDRKLSEAEKK